jgi:hypothetical protein
MTEKKQKRKVERRPVAKVINVQPPRPADDLFNPFAEAKAAEIAKVAASAEMAPTPPQVTSPQVTPPHPTPIITEVAPAKDFNRRANSLERDALPAGLFPGSSKKLYDALYLRTRGAVTPSRTIRAKKKEMMRWAGIGSENTMDSHLRHFLAVGLLRRTFEAGDNSGAVYEVIIPEELGHPTPPHLAPPQVTPPQPTSGQKLAPGSPQKVGWGGVGQTIENTDSSEPPKTSFKTNTERTDDEAFARLVLRLRTAAREITGREPSAAEAERWEQLAELLVTELKIAAGRTENVSSVPAFLTEHLRRRLWKKDQRQVDEEGNLDARKPTSRFEVDATQCPDCFGTGMWYPEGFERGVAKCRHEKLIAKESE